MNKKNIYLSIGLILLLITICILCFKFITKQNIFQENIPIKGIYQQENIPSDSKSILQKNKLKTEKPTKSDTSPIKETLEVPPSPQNRENIQISLVVLDKKYNTDIKKDSSVLDVMKKIKLESTSDNTFDFKYTEYSGLGSFINEINGIKDSSGKYWIYYVNNKEASVGVSNYIIKSGDIISWKQE